MKDVLFFDKDGFPPFISSEDGEQKEKNRIVLVEGSFDFNGCFEYEEFSQDKGEIVKYQIKMDCFMLFPGVILFMGYCKELDIVFISRYLK